MLLRKLRGEEGTAMIMAVLLSAVAVSLSTLAMKNAVHNSNQSSYDRKRVQSVAAAEAGIDYYMSHLQGAAPGDVECSMSESLTGSPATSFTVTTTFYDLGENPITCPFASGVSPDSVLIRSVGTVTTGGPTRTMEAFIKLIEQQGNPFGEGALFSDSAPGLNATVQINGTSSDDADVYTNGSTTTSLSSGTNIGGSLYSQGDVILNKDTNVMNDVWANGSITMNQQSHIWGDAISSTSAITASGGMIHQDATAATLITVAGGGQVHGTQSPNTPSEAPPARTFPVFTYDPTAWSTAGYTINAFTDCADAASFIAGITGGDHVVRIPVNCTLNFANKSTTSLRGNLAIITDGGINMDSRHQILNAAGSGDLELFFFAGLNPADPCDITMASNTRFGAGINSLLYSPCEVSLSSASLVVEGQIFGGEVDFNSTTSLNYTPMVIPGLGSSGYKEDIVYIREVVG